jgi:FdhD protein
MRLAIILNGEEIVSLMCSPWRLQHLVLGFLSFEGLIQGPDEVDLLRVCLEDQVAEVCTRDRRVPAPRPHRILTSGCGGGTTFGAYLDAVDQLRLESPLTVAPEHVYAMMRQLHEQAHLYRQVRGCHTSVLADGVGVVQVGEDIGRHNTLDKIHGACLLRGISSVGHVLLTSGRISSEMLIKCAHMGVPIVCSRTSPTSLAVRLAEDLGICVIGYVRQDTMSVYSHAWRVRG